MSYYLGEAYDFWKTNAPDISDDFDIESEAYEILEEAACDEWLFCEIEGEVMDRYPKRLTKIHMDAFNGVDVRNTIDNLFRKVVKECLSENRNYFSEEK